MNVSSDKVLVVVISEDLKWDNQCKELVSKYIHIQVLGMIKRLKTFGARAFAIAGPTVWNSLPDSLRDPAVGPDQFRRDLKTHLFE